MFIQIPLLIGLLVVFNGGIFEERDKKKEMYFPMKKYVIKVLFVDVTLLVILKHCRVFK